MSAPPRQKRRPTLTGAAGHREVRSHTRTIRRRPLRVNIYRDTDAVEIARAAGGGAV